MRLPAPLATLAVLLTALLTALPGCTDFDTRYIVDDFRVLGVRAVDGPEEQVTSDIVALLMLDLETAGLDELIDAYRVRDSSIDFLIEPLVVDPQHPEGPFFLRARACPYDETLVCDGLEDDEPVMTVVEGLEGTRSNELNFRFSPSSDFVNQAIAADPLRGFGGLYLMLDIEIEGPGGRLRTAKILTINPIEIPLLLGLDPERAFLPNANPEVCGVRVFGAHVSDGIDSAPERTADGFHIALLLNDVVRGNCGTDGNAEGRGGDDAYIEIDEPVVAYAGSEILVRPAGTNDVSGQIRSQEQDYYVLTLPDGAGELPGYQIFTEQIQANIYITAGSVIDDQAFSRTTFGVQISPEFRWTLPTRPGDYPFWIVLRDNRGGVSWIERTITVTRRADAEPCARCPNDPDWTFTPSPPPADESE